MKERSKMIIKLHIERGLESLASLASRLKRHLHVLHHCIMNALVFPKAFIGWLAFATGVSFSH